MIPRLRCIIKRLRSATDNVAIYKALHDLPQEVIAAIPPIAPGLKKKVKKYITLRSLRPFVTGADLKRAGLKQGPQFKKELDRLFESQLRGEIKNRRQALRELENAD
jgi:tRNA nucleotidyltransferase/poly(A) polymerase